MSSDTDTLARTIFGEARGEGHVGMQAVANVIMNRLKASQEKSQWWGNTITEICLKPWQFSCWNQTDPNRHVIEQVTEADATFALACHIAQQAMSGNLPDVTNGATSYYAKSMGLPPYWARGKQPCAVIGNHLFFT